MSEATCRTFLRARLYDMLRRPVLLSSVHISNDALVTKTVHWEDYWQDTPVKFRHHVSHLRDSWTAYIKSDCNRSFAGTYVSAFLALLKAVVTDLDHSHDRFMAQVLGFENFLIGWKHDFGPFAAATTTFRNPVFLSMETYGLRKNDRNDPALLPLIVALDDSGAAVFFHYRKVRLLKFADTSLLFFRHVDKSRRNGSFLGLGALEGMFVDQWGSRIAERCRLLADRVLLPLINGAAFGPIADSQRPWRVLDIGSGSGLFASSLAGRLAASGALRGRPVEMTLLDVVPRSDLRHFRSTRLRRNMSGVTHIAEGYKEWLCGELADVKNARFDLALLCRTLHNFSNFTICTMSSSRTARNIPHSRYSSHSHLSDYYRLIGIIMGRVDSNDLQYDDTCLYYPHRAFDPKSLMADDGESIIAKLVSICNGILIEDSDLTQNALLSHVQSYSCDKLQIYDLSRALRLSVNHVYWLTMSKADGLPSWERIWPQ